MCGISGIINNHLHNELLEKELSEVSLSFSYRGPDYLGKHLEDNVGLSHNRLSIIDLSNSANQPFYSEDKNYVIVFNGEIYNYKELKNEFCQYPYSTNSDTEVILAGYIQIGIEKLVTKLQGMYAFAIWDKAAKKLVLARDYFGKKPLYYYHTKDEFIFTSEIQGITKIRKEHLSINYKSLDYYLTELSVPQPNTIWNEVKQLPSNSYAVLEINSFKFNIIQSNKFVSYQEKNNISEKEALLKTEELLTESIIKRTIADVPIGTFLSGGVDSGLISAILARNSDSKIDTFTLGFDFDDFNEFELAQIVAKKFNTNHHEIKISANIVKDLETIVDNMGEPFSDPSIVPTYYVTKVIGKDLKVALSGDGGDEVFGGYHEYPTAYKTDYLIQKKKLNLVSITKSKILNKLNLSNENLGHYSEFINLKDYQYLYREMGFSPSQKNNLYRSDKLNSKINFSTEYLSNIWKDNFKESYLSGLFDSSLKHRLINDYLVKVDRASMLNSIEVRSPFLDIELVKFVSSIPNSILLKDGNSKYLLKKLAYQYYDKSVFTRKKQGFGMPIKYWLVNELKPLMDFYLSKEKVEKRGLFNYKYIQSLINEHKIHYNHSHRLWTLLVLEMWFEKNNL